MASSIPAPAARSALPLHGLRLGVRSVNRTVAIGFILSLALAACALGAPLIGQLDPFTQSAALRLEPPDAAHVMGRDTFGRDILARVLYAGRVSLTVGLGSVLLG